MLALQDWYEVQNHCPGKSGRGGSCMPSTSSSVYRMPSKTQCHCGIAILKGVITKYRITNPSKESGNWQEYGNTKRCLERSDSWNWHEWLETDKIFPRLENSLSPVAFKFGKHLSRDCLEMHLFTNKHGLSETAWKFMVSWCLLTFPKLQFVNHEQAKIHHKL